METLFLILFLILFSLIIPNLRCYKIDKFLEKSSSSKLMAKSKSIITSNSGNNGLLRNISKSILIPKTNKKAFLFEKKDSSLIVPNLNLSQYTISFYFYTINNNLKQIIINSNNNSLLCVLENKKIYVSMLNDKKRLNLIGKINIESKKWYFITLTVGEKITLYINGTDISINQSFKTNLDSLVFGLSKQKTLPFFGYIGDVLVKSLELSKDDVCKSSIYNKCENTELKPKLTKIIEEEKEKEEIDSFKKLMVDFKNRNKKCEFQAKGPTLLACNDRCMSVDKKDWGGDLCTKEICDSICKGCDDIEQCRWLIDPLENKLALKKPKRLQIKSYPLDGKIKITWMNTNYKDNIIGYYITVTNNNNIIGFNFNNDIECTLCEHTLINLINDKVYTIILYARNKYGLSASSNKIRVSPKKIEKEDITGNIDTKEETKVYNSSGDIKYYSDISVNEYNKVLNFLEPEKKNLQNQYNFNLDVQ